MAITLETIAIEFGAQWTGGGTINRIITDMSRVARATKEMYNPVKNTGLVTGLDAQAQKFAAAGSQALKYSAQIQDVERRMAQLGQAMAGFAGKGNPFKGITDADAATKYRELANEANTAKAALAGIQTTSAGAASSFSKLLGAVVPVTVALGAATLAIVGISKAFSAWKAAAEEGASIRQTGRSFEYLTEQMYGVPNLLGQMKAASRGTISELQLMSSYMTLVAGTTPELGRNISQAVPQLIEIAKAANVLNPALGDTTFFFESLARGIKRTEYRLIDNLGLNVRVGEANKRYAAALGKTVQEMTAAERQQAFLNEVLRVGGQLIDQLGGSVSGLADPYQQLTANTENLGNAFKSLASISFAPLAESLSGFTGELATAVTTYVEAMDNLDRATGNASDREESIQRFIKALFYIPPAVTVASNAINFLTGILRGFNDAVGELVTGSSLTDIFKDLFGGDFSAPFSAEKPTEFANAIEKGEASLAAWKKTATGAIYVGGGLANILGEIGKSADEGGRKIDQMADAQERLNALALIGLRESRTTVQDSLAQVNALEQLRQQHLRNAKTMNDIYSTEEFAQLQTAQTDLAHATVAAWAEINAAREMALSSSWLDIFAGGEFDSDLIIGNIRNVGDAWVTTSGATQEQSDRLAELNDELGRARDKLRDLQDGIGVQGDDAEDTARKISDLSAEIANYERVIGNLNQQIGPSTTSKVHFGLNINDVEAFKQFVQVLGDLGGTTSQLSGVSVALGLISPAAADAMQKVALLDSALRSIALKVKIGELTVEGGAEAARSVIQQLEQDISHEELVIQVRTEIATTRQQNIADLRELRHMGEDVSGFDVNANIDPAMQALGEALGFVSTSEGKIAVAADLEPFNKAVNDARSAVEAMTVTLTIQGVYVPPNNLPNDPTGRPTTNSPGQPQIPYASGGYVGASRNRPVAAVVHGGEFVMRPEAVDRLGVGFLNAMNRGLYSTNNRVSLQNNFYAPIGGGEMTREVIVRSGDDAAEQLVKVLQRSGYKI